MHDARFARLPEPPYYAVVFSSLRNGEDEAGYQAAALRMLELAALQPGYLGAESARGGDRFGITVSYWASEAAIGAALVGYGEDGRVQRIEQAGWIIDYADWKPDAISGVDLPARITALRKTDRVRLVVDRWAVD